MNEPDRGLQAERTVLAWRRTSLAVAAGSVVLYRLSAETLGPAGVLGNAVCLVVALAAYARGARRYREVKHAVTTSTIDGVATRGLLLSVAVGGLATLTTVWALARAVR